MTIAAPLGADRDWAEQVALKANPRAYGSSLPSSKIASPGNSTHGWGTCVDIAAQNAWFQIHCGEYGFVRESPAGENNHYRYTAPTWAVASAPVASPNNMMPDEVRRVATYLNGRAASVGRKTTTANVTGVQGPLYWGLTQAVGKADGLYGAGFLVNEVPGNRTYWLEDHYRTLTAPVAVTPVITPPTPPVSETPVPVPPVVVPPVPAVPSKPVTPPKNTGPVITPVDPKNVDPTHMDAPLPTVKPTANWVTQLLLAIFGKH
jgi:hypothetical protein